MKNHLFVYLLLSFSSMKAEIYDCFTFFNELELLHLRLEELSEVVDHFVLVESPISYTGKSKPLYFQENVNQFDQFKDKIIHIILDQFPDLTNNEEKNHWYRESSSRNAILSGLKGCQDDDIILISDLDEIPRASAIIEIKEYLAQFKNVSKEKLNPTNLVCGLDMRLFMYSMNRENLKGWYGGSKATHYWMIKEHTPWGIKLFHQKYAMHKITNAGWHFNTMGGKEKSLYKWLHTGPTYPPGFENGLLQLQTNPSLLKQSYDEQIATHTVIVPIDGSYPKYFLDNLDYFREIGWIAE